MSASAIKAAIWPDGNVVELEWPAINFTPVEPREVVIRIPELDALPCSNGQTALSVSGNTSNVVTLVQQRVCVGARIEVPEPAALNIDPVERLGFDVPNRPFPN